MRTTTILPLAALALSAAIILTIASRARQKQTPAQALWLLTVRSSGLLYALSAAFLLFKLLLPQLNLAQSERQFCRNASSSSLEVPMGTSSLRRLALRQNFSLILRKV